MLIEAVKRVILESISDKNMFLISLLSACLHAPPDAPTPAARAARIHTPLLVETNRSLLGMSVLVRGGSAADPVGQEGVGAAVFSAISDNPAIEVFKKAGGQFRSEWHRDYGVLHYRWKAGADLNKELSELLNAQLTTQWASDAVFDTVQNQFQKWDTKEADAGMPSLLDAWLQTGLIGHPYSHPIHGSSPSRATIERPELANAFGRLFCTGNIHVGWAENNNPTLPQNIRNTLNKLPTCTTEVPTPKPMPRSTQPLLVVLESSASGTHAFTALPNRATYRVTTPEDLAWGQHLLDNGNAQGPLHRALAKQDIEAFVSVRLFPKGERWKQPLLQVHVRTQDADPVALFDTLVTTLSRLHQHGWSPRDVHREQQNQRLKPGSKTANLRLESQLLAHVFGPSPKANLDSLRKDTQTLLSQSIAPSPLVIVMQVSESESLLSHAHAQGFTSQRFKKGEWK